MDALDTLQDIRQVVKAYEMFFGTRSADSYLSQISEILDDWVDD